MHKLRKAGGVGQVDVGVRLHAVTVAAGDQQHVPLFRQAPHGAVLVPVAQAVQLQRVKIGAILLQKLVDQEFVLFLADQVQVPHGVVEDHQHIRLAMKSAQNLGEPRVAGMGGELLKRRHPLRRAGAGQVVHAEMEGLQPP